jgi:hypothetical protein
MDSRIARRPRIALIAALGLAGLFANDVEAQQWGRPRTPSAGACFYRDANYRGDYFCLRSGEDLNQMPSGLNDRISSIRTFGGVEVVLFRNPDFSGRSARVYNDVSNLQTEGWNDTLSSLAVRGRGGNSNWGGGYPGGRGYEGGGYSGGSGYAGGNPDRIIQRAYQDLLDRDPDQTGLREYRRRMIDDGWTEAQVRDAIRRSPEYREKNTLTRDRAEDMVRRAYQSVLGREPDPAARSWVDNVIRYRMSQQQLEAELRKTPEYRNRRPGF